MSSGPFTAAGFIRRLRVAAMALGLVVWVHVPAQAQSGGAIATVGLTTGWATFGEAVPQGAATSGLKIGGLPTQTDVKNRWPDGSIKFAIVSANVPSNDTYQITAASAATGSFTPAAPTASVTLTIGGTPYVASLSGPAADMWLDGPLVREWRSVVAPVAAGSAHSFLRVIFDTRVFADGAGRVSVTVENVLNQADATTTTYDVSIAVNGTTRFAQASVE